MVTTPDHFDDWLKDALEHRLGSVVQDKISSLERLEPRMLEALSDELVHSVCRNKEMADFRNNALLQGIPPERELFASHGAVALSDRSADASPRNDKSQDSFAAADRPSRSGLGQRMQALEVLLKVPVGDIVGSANWHQLQQELCESLRDDSWTMFMQVLKVLARLASSAGFGPMREGFLSLLEGLTLCYLTLHLHQQLPSAVHGIQQDNVVHRRIILISQCLLQVLNQVPGKWIRYGEKRSQEIVDNFVDLLSMHTHHRRSLNSDQSKDVLYPFHIFSILDPEAKWCDGVMHAAFGRNILMKSVIKSTSLIRFIVEEVVIWLSSQMKFSEGATAIYEFGSNGNVNGNLISMSVFIHCISLVKLFIDSDRGHLLFPVLTSIQEDPISVYSMLLKVLGFLNKVSNEPKMKHSDRLLKILENVCASMILSRGSRILHGSSVDLIHLLLEVPNKMDHFSIHIHNMSILYKISESPSAIRWMLGRPIRKAREGLSRAISDLRISLSSASSSGRESALTTNRTISIARRVAQATAAAVRGRNRFTASEADPQVCQLLYIGERLFSTPEGYLVLESSEGQLVFLVGSLFMHFRNIMFSSDLELLHVQGSIESFLMGITLTPMGFSAVSAVEGLVRCLVASHVESPLPRYEEPRFLHLLQLTTSIPDPDTKMRSYGKSLLKHALNKLWAALDTGSECMWQEAKRHFMTIVLSIGATPSAVSEMLDIPDQEESMSESTLVEEIEPLSFRELLVRGLQSSHEASHFQEISLHILHCLAHNIDIGLVLEEKLMLMECLQKMLLDNKVKEQSNELTVQPSPRWDKPINVVDETTRSCSHILTIMNQLRDSSSCNLIIAPRSPRSPRSHAHTSRPRVQTELQRFLQDTRHGLHDNMWMSHARRAYRSCCRSELKVSVLLDLLDQVLQSQPSPVSPDVPLRWPSDVECPSYSQQFAQAIDMIIRYGCHIKALNLNMMNQHQEQLSLLLNQSQIFLRLHNTGNSFDWFTSSVFLMCSGNIDRSRSILQRVAMLPSGPFIWVLLSQNTAQLTASINQQLQCLLVEYLPKAYNVLQEAGVPWWLIAERLTRQAFLLTVPLSQLPHIIALAALHSWEYHLYMQTAILAHIQPYLLDASSHRSILSLLAESRMDNFIIGDYLPFMDKLAKLNRPYLVRDRIATATL